MLLSATHILKVSGFELMNHDKVIRYQYDYIFHNDFSVIFKRHKETLCLMQLTLIFVDSDGYL